MTRHRASTAKRKKSLAPAAPTVQSPPADNVHDSSPAANAIGCSIDLLTEILLRLPVKSLIRFKCVSKIWLSLLSASQFALDHSRLNPRPNTVSGLYFYGAYRHSYSPYRLKSVSFHREQNLPSLPLIGFLGRMEGLTKIADSCNGLMLCENIDYESNCKYHAARYAVCNVTTQKYRVVPDPEPQGNAWHSDSVFLAFDPSKSPHYKVILVHPAYPAYEIDVFSSQTGCWKKVFAQHRCYGPGVYWNGAIHWVDSINCLRFDVAAEEMIATPNPPLPKILMTDSTRYLGECGGSLFLIQSRSNKVLGFRILEFHGNWSTSYQVNLRPIIAEYPEIETSFEFTVLSLLCAGDVQKKEDFTLVLAIPGRIIAYNLHQKTCDKLCDLSDGYFIKGVRNGYAYPFVETLALI